MSKRLYDCATAVERLELVRHRLTPDEATGLRATGVEIETITVDRVDHNGDRHTGCTEWRLMTSPIGREAAALARRRQIATIKHPVVPENEKAA